MSTVEVAVAVIVSPDQQQVLISQRAADVHLGGKWEFPGGKLEPGETPFQALQREIEEELGVTIQRAAPILTLPFRYPEKDVILHVFRVIEMTGQPGAKERQPLRYAAIESLSAEHFPPANRSIITWLQLPSTYFITPDAVADSRQYIQLLENAIHAGCGMLQFRSPSLDPASYADLARQLWRLCEAARLPLLLNCSLELFAGLPASGLHLSAARASQFSTRPIAMDRILACSCHNDVELQQAARLGADLVVLGPVKATLTHPGAPVLGWEGFARLGQGRPFAVYALGGLQHDDLRHAQGLGARGIAAIRAFL